MYVRAASHYISMEKVTLKKRARCSAIQQTAVNTGAAQVHLGVQAVQYKQCTMVKRHEHFFFDRLRNIFKSHKSVHVITL